MNLRVPLLGMCASVCTAAALCRTLLPGLNTSAVPCHTVLT